MSFFFTVTRKSNKKRGKRIYLDLISCCSVCPQTSRRLWKICSCQTRQKCCLSAPVAAAELKPSSELQCDQLFSRLLSESFSLKKQLWQSCQPTHPHTAHIGPQYPSVSWGVAPLPSNWLMDIYHHLYECYSVYWWKCTKACFCVEALDCIGCGIDYIYYSVWT